MKIKTLFRPYTLTALAAVFILVFASFTCYYSPPPPASEMFGLAYVTDQNKINVRYSVNNLFNWESANFPIVQAGKGTGVAAYFDASGFVPCIVFTDTLVPTNVYKMKSVWGFFGSDVWDVLKYKLLDPSYFPYLNLAGAPLLADSVAIAYKTNSEMLYVGSTLCDGIAVPPPTALTVPNPWLTSSGVNGNNHLFSPPSILTHNDTAIIGWLTFVSTAADKNHLFVGRGKIVGGRIEWKPDLAEIPLPADPGNNLESQSLLNALAMARAGNHYYLVAIRRTASNPPLGKVQLFSSLDGYNWNVIQTPNQIEITKDSVSVGLAGDAGGMLLAATLEGPSPAPRPVIVRVHVYYGGDWHDVTASLGPKMFPTPVWNKPFGLIAVKH